MLAKMSAKFFRIPFAAMFADIPRDDKTFCILFSNLKAGCSAFQRRL